jgi:ABC-type uncharacterized transport system permease subunit
MIAITSGMLAVLLYFLSTLLQWKSLTQNADYQNAGQNQNKVLLFAVLALAAHLVNVISIIATDAGYDFGTFRIATLFSWTISFIVVSSSLKKPLANLFLVLFPLAILSILGSLFLPSRYDPQTNMENGVALHSVLGIVGFSLITIAAVQALLIAWLNRELKRKHFTSLLRHMPPLQTMEALLFEIIWAGFLALLAVILTGFVFMEDMFAQHLVHKTVLTLISWGVFGILLWGRHQLGWRGKTAMRWTLGGFIVLILAYFGSKFVLELLLNRV